MRFSFPLRILSAEHKSFPENNMNVRSSVFALLGICMLTVFVAGCARKQRTESPGRTSVSLPIASGKVWRDTTAQTTIKGIGTFTVSSRDGEITVEPPEGLKKFRWAVVSSRSDTAAPPAQRATAPASAGDMDGDGVPDCEDWCMEVPGTPENRGCPPGVEGTPPIRWVELLRMTEGGDEIIVQFGLDECGEE